MLIAFPFYLFILRYFSAMTTFLLLRAPWQQQKYNYCGCETTVYLFGVLNTTVKGAKLSVTC